MKTSTFLTTVFGLGLATAQNLSGQPACASPCLSSAITAAGCALADQGCQCGTGKASIQNLVATCLLSGCNPTDLAAAASVGNALCVAYSATAPGGAGTTGTASTGGVLTIQTSTGPLTTTATTSLAATTGTSTGTTGTGSTGTTSGGSTGGATTSPATTSPPSSSAATSGSGTGAEAGTSSTSTAGAAQGVVAGAGGVVGLLLGLVAAL